MSQVSRRYAELLFPACLHFVCTIGWVGGWMGDCVYVGARGRGGGGVIE